MAIGGDLSPKRIIAAYSLGIFPWFGPGEPILWWSPDPRLVLFPEEIHISRRLNRLQRQKRFTISLNLAFDQVIGQCATVKRKQGEGTWIVPEMIKAYTKLHQSGYGHSIEVWDTGGTLCGGLYGLALGQAFFGESMFHLKNNCSKLALTALANLLKQSGFVFLDCQLVTPHLLRMGARPISRKRFFHHLEQALKDKPDPSTWSPRVISSI